jgi:hypothetical protein
MAVVFDFLGGAMHERRLRSDAADPWEASEAGRLYQVTANGVPGSRLRLVPPAQGGVQAGAGEPAPGHDYLVTERVEEGENVVVRCQAVKEAGRETGVKERFSS